MANRAALGTSRRLNSEMAERGLAERLEKLLDLELHSRVASPERAEYGRQIEQTLRELFATPLASGFNPGETEEERRRWHKKRLSEAEDGDANQRPDVPERAPDDGAECGNLDEFEGSQNMQGVQTRSDATEAETTI